MYKLRARLGVPTVRTKIKLGSASERLQAVLDLKQSDIQGRWGVAQVRQRLANKGVTISRYVSLSRPAHNHPTHGGLVMNLGLSFTTISIMNSTDASQGRCAAVFHASRWIALVPCIRSMSTVMRSYLHKLFALAQ